MFKSVVCGPREHHIVGPKLENVLQSLHDRLIHDEPSIAGESYLPVDNVRHRDLLVCSE